MKYVSNYVQEDLSTVYANTMKKYVVVHEKKDNVLNALHR